MDKRICSIEGCDARHYGQGYCNRHWSRWRRHGDPLVVLTPLPPPTCTVDDCGSPGNQAGMCSKHRQRFRKYGTTDLPARARANEGDCIVPGCDLVAVAKSMCSNHRKRAKLYGDPLFRKERDKDRPCSAPDCERPARRYGHCTMHSQRLMKYGSIELPEAATTCAGPDCERPVSMSQGGGLCRSHYAQQRRGKPLTKLGVASKNLGRPPVCIYPGCERPHKARGYCKGHNDHLKAGKDLRDLEVRDPGPCSVEGCTRMKIAQGLCTKHYSNRLGRWAKYGISPEHGFELYRIQDGRCAACVQPFPLESLHVDHDHDCCTVEARACGSCVRGLLCGPCNMGLGQFRDDPVKMRSAIAYLERFTRDRPLLP